MKKMLVLFSMLTTCFFAGLAQQNVGINTTSPDPSAALHVEATDKGLLIPRLTSAQRTGILNAATGLMVFDTDTESFWYRESNGWTELAGQTWKKNGDDIFYKQGKVGIGTGNPSHPFEIVTEVLEAVTLDGEQTIIGTGGSNYSGDRWQSFTAGISGDLTKLEARLWQGPWNGTLYLYEGEGTGGNLLHSQPYEMVGQSWQTFPLTTPLRLAAGEKYTFRISNSSWFISNANDPYPEGRSSADAVRDFNFRTYISAAVQKTTVAVTENRVGIAKTAPEETLDVAGAIKINNTTNPSPTAGTIRWNETIQDFEGYTGSEWKSLTQAGNTWGKSKFTESRQTSSSDASDFEGFGWAVDVDGSTAVIGTSLNKAFVFERSGSEWAEVAKLVPSNGGYSFGKRVSISGDHIIVGDFGGPETRGFAYIFTKPVGGWAGTLTESAQLIASDNTVNDFFGIDVSISGDIAIVANDNLFSTPNVYVFIKPGGGWSGNVSESATLNLDFERAQSIDIFEDVVIAGVSNSAKIFIKPGGDWSGNISESATLSAASGGTQRFGTSLSISNNTVVVGDPGHNGNQGAAYVYQEPGGGWSGTLTESAKLIGSDIENNEYFGDDVAISGDLIVVGSYRKNGSRGQAYLYEKPAGGWSGTLAENVQFVASDPGPDFRFGRSVCIAADHAIFGATRANNNKGKAYFFNR